MSTCILDPNERSAYLCRCQHFGLFPVTFTLPVGHGNATFNVSLVSFPDEPVGGLLLPMCVTAEHNHDSDIFKTNKKTFLVEKRFARVDYLPHYTVLQFMDSSLKYGQLLLQPSSWALESRVEGAAASPVGKGVATLPK